MTKLRSFLALGLGSLTLCGAVCGGLFAQSRNVSLLSNIRPESRFNDVWGYVDRATGREAVIFGGASGVYIYETTNPRSPVRRGYFSASQAGWRSCTWSDMKEWKGYAFVVSECGGGLQIIDMRNLNAPKFVKVWGTQYWSHSHNVGIDRKRGILCVHGTGGSRGESVRFVDVNTDPENPRLLATWSSPYIHDMSWQDNLLHTANIYSGQYGLYDTSQSMSNPTLLGSVTTPRAFTHNTWPSYDNKICVTTDERSRGPMACYDISARGNPVYLSQYQTGGSSSIIHNVYLNDYVCHMSYYTEGYRAVDLSNPRSPVEVGYYDTWSGSSRGYNGAWGCYAFQPSGNIYISDIQRGLFVFKPRASAVRYGTGTPGTGNRLPHIHTIGSAFVGNANFKLGVREGKANTGAVMFLGVGRVNINIGNSGLWLHVPLAPPPFLLPTATGSTGAALIPFGIPNDTRLNGFVLNGQWFLFDANGKLGWSSSRGLEIEVFNQ